MKVFKELSLSDQKVMFENLFIWDSENGEKPGRLEYKKWIIAFFHSDEEKKEYINNLTSDINLLEDDDLDLTNSYKRQITFLTDITRQ